jgi:sugar phosphate isomerase/epimerase
MKPYNTDLSRRSFLGLIAAAPLGAAALAAQDSNHIPIGLELYSVRDELKKDLAGTVEGVAKMGYECVEFYAPYYQWTTDATRQMRSKLDDLSVRCYSTHNDRESFTPAGINKAIELNQILGARYIVMAWPGEPKTADDWKKVADTLNQANDAMKSHGLHAGYHNHDAEWKPVGGQKPLEIIASNTDKSVALQLDVGTCLETGNDPVAWVKKNPGRIRSLHLKDWSPQNGYRVLFGEGVAPWAELLAAAEATGGAEYFLIEQEGSRYPEMETVRRCLHAYHALIG